MAENLRIHAIAVKTESARLSDATPTIAANGLSKIIGAPPAPRVGYLETNDRADAQTGTLEADARASAAGRYATLSFTQELHGLGSTYGATPNVVDYDPLLRAAAFGRVASGSAPNDLVDYPSADMAATATLYAWCLGGESYGAKLYRLTGCVANGRINIRSGQVPTITWDVSGVMATDVAEAAISGTPPAMPTGPVFSAGTASIGSFNYAAGLRLLDAEINFGNTIAARAAGNAPDAHDGYEVTARQATARVRFFSVSISAYNAWAKSRSGSDALTLAWGAGGLTYNGITIAAPAFEAAAPEAGEESNMGVIQITGNLKKSGATRALTITTR